MRKSQTAAADLKAVAAAAALAGSTDLRRCAVIHAQSV